MKDLSASSHRSFQHSPTVDLPTAVAGSSVASLVPNLMEVSRQDGYASGYDAAISQLLDTLIYATEEFLKAQFNIEVPPDQRRRLVYRYEEHLERHVHRLAQENAEAA